MLLPVVIALAVGYLLGALPFGYLVARAHAVDIFKAGSGSSGATNVKRVLGAKAGNTVFALDVLKGVAAAGLWRIVEFKSAIEPGNLDPNSVTPLVGLVGALLGHSFSCFTRFKGGKGVATGAGGLLVLLPLATLIAGAAWIIVFYASRYVSLASIVASIVLPLAAWLQQQPVLLIGFAALVTVFVVVRHLSNIRRLIDGTENRFARKPRETPRS